MSSVKSIVVGVVISVLSVPLVALASETSYELSYEKFELQNGLDVVVHENRSTPSVAVYVVYNVGSKDEEPGKTGFAHLFEHLMFEETENSGGAIADVMKESGVIFLNGSTSNDSTNYFEVVPSSALDVALWLESERMGHVLGALSQDRLDEQRGVVQNELRQRRAIPYADTFDILAAHMYPEGHPYSWSVGGSIEDLNNTSLDDFKLWFRKFYGPNNVTIVLAGDVSVEEARAKVEKYFAAIPPNPPITRQLSDPATGEFSGRVRHESRVPNDQLTMAWNVPGSLSDEVAAITAVAGILGRGRTSLLHRRLVEELEIATEVHGFYLPRDIGGQVVLIVKPKENVSLARIEQEMRDVVSKLVSGKVSADLLRQFKRANALSSVRGLDGLLLKALALGGSNRLFDDPGYYAKELEQINALAPSAVDAAAKNWLGKEPFVLETVRAQDVSAVASDGSDRQRPALNGEPDLNLPPISDVTLSNGLRVLSMEQLGVPYYQAELIIESGAVYDPDGKFGLSAATADMLDEGAGRMNAQDFAAALVDLGVDVQARPGLERSKITIAGLPDTLDDAMALVADMVVRPSFDADALERVKAQQVDAIATELARPTAASDRVIGRSLFGNGHPYDRPHSGLGYTEEVRSIDVADVKEFHQRHYAPSRATLIVAGSFGGVDVQKTAEQSFKRWRDGGSHGSYQPVEVPTVVQQPARVYLIDKPGATQSSLTAAFLIDLDEDSLLPVRFSNSIIGSGLTSRMSANLREEKGWTYGIRSQLVELDQDYFKVSASVQSDKTVPAIKEILRELKEFSSLNPVTEEEFRIEKQNLTYAIGGAYDSIRRLIAVLSDHVEHGRSLNHPNERLDGTKALKISDVHTVASVFSPDNVVWIVEGDFSVIEDEVRAAGIGPVEIIEPNK